MGKVEEKLESLENSMNYLQDLIKMMLKDIVNIKVYTEGNIKSQNKDFYKISIFRYYEHDSLELIYEQTFNNEEESKNFYNYLRDILRIIIKDGTTNSYYVKYQCKNDFSTLIVP